MQKSLFAFSNSWRMFRARVYYISLLEKQMRVAKLIGSFLRDEAGGEVLEYALIAGLIVIVALATIGSVGTKVLARWNSVNSKM
jgi:pilus assembly protein Flp/PilA